MTRWYAPSLGRFISEDSLLGDPARPPSRHLYAYGEGEPIGRWDPDGRFWWRVAAGTTWSHLEAWFGVPRQGIQLGNPGRGITDVRIGWGGPVPPAGTCIWIPSNRQEHFCNWHRGDVSRLNSANLYWRYDGVLKFMTAEMNNNRNFLWAKYPDGLARVINGRADFYSRVRNDGPWDHKARLRTWWGNSHEFWTPVRSDPAPERLYYDIWSNVHYGYVGSSIGISEAELMSLQHLAAIALGGVNDAADDLSVRVGIRLWQTYGAGLTQDRVTFALALHMGGYRATGLPHIIHIPLRS